MTYIGCDSMITAFGDREATLGAMERGETALRFDPELGIIAGRIRDVVIDEGLTKAESLLVHCIADVCSKSGISMSDPDTQLVISSTKGNIELIAGGRVPAEAYLSVMGHRVAGRLSCAREPIVISNACISGVSAFVVARRLILEGLCKRAIVSGCDVLSEFICSGFASFKSLSAAPCRPYDRDRDGLNLGEACGAVLLTSVREEALAGLQELIVMEGGAVSDDANHISGPSRTGEELKLAICRAMSEAGAGPDDVGFVNTHGTATAYNDEMESKAVTLAGLADKPLNSLKGYLGHTLGAAGVIDIIVSAEELRRGRILPTCGFSELGVSCQVGVSAHSQELSVRRCVKTASGFGGCNAAVVIAEESAVLKRNELPDYEAVELAYTSLQHKGDEFGAFIKEEYRRIGLDYIKFYKMSDLAKAVFIACEQLTQKAGIEDAPEDIAVILANKSASLDADVRHQKNIESPDGASPAVFVYTLPNVAAGELCIRHKWKGDNTFFIENEDSGLSCRYAEMLIRRGHAKAAICGWAECFNGICDVRLHLLARRKDFPTSLEMTD